MESLEQIKELVQNAASDVMMVDVSSMEDVEGLKKIFDDISTALNDIDDMSEDIKNQLSDEVGAASKVANDIIGGGSGDINLLISSVSDSVEKIQGLLDSPCELTDVVEELVAEVVEAVEAEEAVAGTVIEADDAELVVDFVTESFEHIESAEAGLLELESNPEDSEALNMIFRAFHTVKGMAGFLNLAEIGTLAHSAENLLDMARKSELVLIDSKMDIVFESIDMLKSMLNNLQEAVDGDGHVASAPGLNDIVGRLKFIQENPGEAVGAPAKVVEESAEELDAEVAEVVESSSKEETDSLDFEEIGELNKETVQEVAEAAGVVNSKPEVVKPVEVSPSTPKKVATPVKHSASDEKIKVSMARLDKLINMVGELVISQSMVRQDVTSKLPPESDVCRQVVHQGKIVRELQELSMMMRMVPIQGVFQKMTRVVRDTSRKIGKKVEMVTVGEDTELDRIVVDQIGDPLVHMIRNSVDHGIEKPEDRVKAGKDPVGRVELRAFHQAGNVVIEITDDGAGLNRDKILKKAIDNGVVSPDAEISDQEVYKLIFSAGLSTAETVTAVSGRGVGMDVVKKNIESLRGKVDISSTPGKGSVFTIRLPLTLAIIDGQIVRIGTQRYIVPITSIEGCLRPTSDQISTIRETAEMARVHGMLLPMARLYNLFNIKPDTEDPTEASLVVVEEDGRRGCLMVDEVLGQQQVVIKSLGHGIGSIKGVSGGAILGDGRVSLILDVPGLLEIAW